MTLNTNDISVHLSKWKEVMGLKREVKATTPVIDYLRFQNGFNLIVLYHSTRMT